METIYGANSDPGYWEIRGQVEVLFFLVTVVQDPGGKPCSSDIRRQSAIKLYVIS